MTYLRWANLILATLALLPPLAHILELPNKFALDSVTWLIVQQQLYRGWGPFLGGPAEIGTLVTTLTLLAVRRWNGKTWRLTIIAAVAYAMMIVTFFILNAPVNVAVARWTSATLPNDWENYRLRWESGHAIAAVLAAIGLTALVRAWRIEVASGSAPMR